MDPKLMGKKGKKQKMSPYEKAAKKQQKQKASKKSSEYSKGVMSFDSFFDEAGTFNNADAEDAVNDANIGTFDEDSMWDDDYDWTAGALRHEDFNEVNPHFIHEEEKPLPSLADLIDKASEKPMEHMSAEAHLAADAYLKAVEEQALHDLVPLLPSYVAEEVESHGLPEVQYADSEETGHAIHRDEDPVFELEEEGEIEGHAPDENQDGVDNVNTFSEQDFMNYVIKLVI